MISGAIERVHVRAATWLALALALGLLTACGVSSVNDVSSGLTEKNGTGDSKVLAGVAAEKGQTQTGPSPLLANTAAKKEAERAIAPSNPKSNAYKIGPDDVIDVAVFKVPELSKSAQVNETGNVNLPLVGEFPAVGRTTREIEQDLTKTLGAKYLRNPQVNVTVKEYNSQRVTLEGDVKKPGIYPFRGRMTLLQLVASAGGFETTADTEVIIFRGTDGKTSAAKFDFEAIRAGTAKDPELSSGDVVIVNASAAKAAFQNVLKALPLVGLFATIL